jgi:hypothetical protein
MIFKETIVISYTCHSTGTYSWGASVGNSFLAYFVVVAVYVN